MKDILPINKEILQWARTTIGLSFDEVASKMDKPKEVIIEWESGKTTPTYSQLEKLAYQVYKRPVAVFFFPNIPEEENPKTVFRTLPDVVIDQLPSQMIKIYRKAKIFQINLQELYENSKPINPNLIDTHSFNNSDIVSLANSIRSDLGYTIDDQFSWQSIDVAFKKWRLIFETKGIFVFKDAFHIDDYSGFCVFDENYPIIFINNSMPQSRQIFTLFHELGHLLFHQGGIDYRDKSIFDTFDKEYIRYEILCNKLANEILVPSSVFKSLEHKVAEEWITHLASQFSVSREVILRNYLDYGIIDEKYYSKMAYKWINEAKKIKEESEGGHYYYTQKAYLGDKYINIAFSHYYQNKISVETLAEYLNIKVKNIPSFEHYAIV